MSQAILEKIQKIQWFNNPKSSNCFKDLKVDYGFVGLGKIDFPPPSHLKQVHGTEIIKISAASHQLESKDLIQGDGIYTLDKIPIAIKTADCLPIFLCDSKSSLLMIIHAGWKGLSQGIVQKAIKIFEKQNITADNILALGGPCISPSHFEVGPEVMRAYTSSTLGLTKEQQLLVIKKGASDRWFLDLSTSAACLLLNLGLNPENISILRSCTFTEKKLWPSYRRNKKCKNRIWNWARLR